MGDNGRGQSSLKQSTLDHVIRPPMSWRLCSRTSPSMWGEVWRGGAREQATTCSLLTCWVYMKALFKYLTGSCTENRQYLFSLTPDSKTHDRRPKLQEARFKLNIEKNFLTVRAVWHWNQLPWQVVSAPMLEAFKRKLVNLVSDLPWLGWQHWAGGWTPWPRTLLPAQLVYDTLILWIPQSHVSHFAMTGSTTLLMFYSRGVSTEYAYIITIILGSFGNFSSLRT